MSNDLPTPAEIRADMARRAKEPPTPPTALELIARERFRQMDREGWTPSHDDEHDTGELADAAACYALTADRREMESMTTSLTPWTQERRCVPRDWPWEVWAWKPTPDDRIRELVKAGALIVAEIERLQRESGPEPKEERR